MYHLIEVSTCYIKMKFFIYLLYEKSVYAHNNRIIIFKYSHNGYNNLYISNVFLKSLAQLLYFTILCFDSMLISVAINQVESMTRIKITRAYEIQYGKTKPKTTIKLKPIQPPTLIRP